MIDIESQYIKDYLDGITIRVREVAEAFDWLEGKQKPRWDKILPNVNTNNEKTRQALDRYRMQMQSIGPRAFRAKLSGVVGVVNWGGDSKELDKRLRDLDINALARVIFKELFVSGICALYAFTDQQTGQEKLQVLGGYIEPLYPEDDLGGEVIGLYQVLSSGDTVQNKYNIRVYDFEEKAISHWNNKDEPYEVGFLPDEVFENQLMPMFSIMNKTQDGYASGEFLNALPLVMAEFAQQLRTIRISESHVFAPVYFKGQWKASDQIGPHIAYRATDAGWTDAEIGRVQAGDMQGQFDLADKTLERVRADLSLPVNFTGTQPPSGVSLEQMNIAYITSIRDYAERIGWLLTKGVQNYSELVEVGNTEDVLVSVTPNREHFKSQVMADITNLFEKGLMPKSVAARELQPYFETWSDDELKEFIRERPPPIE